MNTTGIPANHTRCCWKQRSMTLSFVYKEIAMMKKQNRYATNPVHVVCDQCHPEGQEVVRELRGGRSPRWSGMASWKRKHFTWALKDISVCAAEASAGPWRIDWNFSRHTWGDGIPKTGSCSLTAEETSCQADLSTRWIGTSPWTPVLTSSHRIGSNMT